MFLTAVGCHPLQSAPLCCKHCSQCLVPQFRSVAPNILSQTPQNVTVVLGVDILTLGDKVMLHIPLNVKENHHLLLVFVPAVWS